MFDFPFTFPKQTIYQELGLTPEASAEDIREAKSRRQTELKAQCAFVEKALNEVYAKVPGLREALAQEQTLEKSNKASDAVALTDVRRQLSLLIPRALEANLDFRRLQKEHKDLDLQSRDINLITLDNPDRRLEYDRRNPPLGLLRFVDAAQDGFVESRTALFLVRRELSGFFCEKGETVFHPSDMTRREFHRDYAYNQELDEDCHAK